MVEQKVNAIVAEIIRALGPVVLRNFLGNNRPGATGSSSSDGSTATAASPFDDDDFDVDGSKSTSSNGRVSISLPTYPPDEDEDTESPNGTTTTTESSVVETTKIDDAIRNAERTTDVSNTIAWSSVAGQLGNTFGGQWTKGRIKFPARTTTAQSGLLRERETLNTLNHLLLSVNCYSSSVCVHLCVYQTRFSSYLSVYLSVYLSLVRLHFYVRYNGDDRGAVTLLVPFPAFFFFADHSNFRIVSMLVFRWVDDLSFHPPSNTSVISTIDR